MNKKGFTIIEVVASIAIVLFITAMVIYNVAGMSDKSKNEIYKDKINLALIKAKEYGNRNLNTFEKINLSKPLKNGYFFVKF